MCCTALSWAYICVLHCIIYIARVLTQTSCQHFSTLEKGHHLERCWTFQVGARKVPKVSLLFKVVQTNSRSFPVHIESTGEKGCQETAHCGQHIFFWQVRKVVHETQDFFNPPLPGSCKNTGLLRFFHFWFCCSLTACCLGRCWCACLWGCFGRCSACCWCCFGGWLGGCFVRSFLCCGFCFGSGCRGRCFRCMRVRAFLWNLLLLGFPNPPVMFLLLMVLLLMVLLLMVLLLARNRFVACLSLWIGCLAIGFLWGLGCCLSLARLLWLGDMRVITFFQSVVAACTVPISSTVPCPLLCIPLIIPPILSPCILSTPSCPLPIPRVAFLLWLCRLCFPLGTFPSFPRTGSTRLLLTAIALPTTFSLPPPFATPSAFGTPSPFTWCLLVQLVLSCGLCWKWLGLSWCIAKKNQPT